jgi:23S rRNA A2030 N6-methylase RlmJ
MPGAGFYALAGGYAEQNKGWNTGGQNLWKRLKKQSETPSALNGYPSYIKTFAAYPGSPALAPSRCRIRKPRRQIRAFR